MDDVLKHWCKTKEKKKENGEQDGKTARHGFISMK